jgi:DNA-binding transcriptional MerR regulator
MPEIAAEVQIPRRALFKPAEVCDLLNVQPYVLRSWESEFPALGISKTAGGPRVYRRVDVEQVVRIKHLLLVEGLTLAGARRRLEEESTPIGADMPVIDELIGQHARERLTEVKRGLRSILELLSGQLGRPPRAAAAVAVAPRAAASRPRPSRGRAPASRRPAAARRKRS